MKFVILFLFSFLPLQLHAQSSSTWDIIQTDIFNSNCVTCHREGTSFATQSGLILTSDVAYDNLIDVAPKNSAARADGLIRVSSQGTVAAPHQSFLWEKINAPNQTHFFADHPNYGAIMPLGLPPLTNGEIAFIEEWIVAGAPREGQVVDVSVLDDTTRYVEPEFAPLPPPERGMQFHLGPFDVWPAEKWDREFLYYWPEPTGEDLFIKRYEITMRQGSHHFILFNYPKGVTTPPPHEFRDLRDQNGTPNIPNLIVFGNLFPFRALVGTQTPFVDYSFPPGIALRLPAGSGFDLNSHYVNRTGETQQGEVYVNLHTVDRSEIEHVAEFDNFGNFDISLPPQQVTTLTAEGFFDETRHIVQMWTHSHEHTLEFRVEIIGGERDGELIYWTNDWEHPPLLQFEPPLRMQPDEGLRMITTYDNWTDETIRFGPLSSDEMQFVFYLFYRDSTTNVDEPSVPDGFTLKQNYPNPFNPGTVIEYSLATDAHVTLEIYNTLGQVVEILVDEFQTADTYGITFTGDDLPAGLYFYKLRTAGRAEVRKMILMK